MPAPIITPAVEKPVVTPVQIRRAVDRFAQAKANEAAIAATVASCQAKLIELGGEPEPGDPVRLQGTQHKVVVSFGQRDTVDWERIARHVLREDQRRLRRLIKAASSKSRPFFSFRLFGLSAKDAS